MADGVVAVHRLRDRYLRPDAVTSGRVEVSRALISSTARSPASIETPAAA
jgi:hypothetical protein